MSYIGLEDYDDGLNTGYIHYADRALLLMQQSLGSNFYQTIGCFASKSEVEGIVVIYNQQYSKVKCN